MANNNATGHFVWLASDGWTPENRISMKGLERETVGAFSFKYQSEYIPALYRHMADVLIGCSGHEVDGCDNRCHEGETSPLSTCMVHALREAAWNSLSHCATSSPDVPQTKQCLRRSNATVESILSNMDISSSYSLTVDAVWTFAFAAHRLISDLCPGAKGLSARKCIRGDTFLKYLKQMSFTGSSGVVKFNPSGDAAGRYLVKQIVLGPKKDPIGIGFNGSQDIGLNAEIVAYYDIEKSEIGLTENPISWSHLNRVTSLSRARNLQNSKANENFEDLDYEDYSGETSEDRYLYNDINYSDLEDGSAPESVCSRPCRPGEFVILREPAPCCWECRACRDNERLVRRNTSCERCQEFTWPDPQTSFRTCAVIAVTYPLMSELLPMLQIFLGTLAIVISLVIVACYVYFRESRVIKAASRELSVLQMAATFVGYVTVILFQVAPSPFICGALYFLFCLSFALLYCPLLVKAVRIYRIFNSTAKSTRRPKFVSPASQVVMTVCLVAVQVSHV